MLSQSTLHDFDEGTSAVFFALISQSAVSCWNSNKRLSPESQDIVAQDDVTMNYPVDLSVSNCFYFEIHIAVSTRICHR